MRPFLFFCHSIVPIVTKCFQKCFWCEGLQGLSICFGCGKQFSLSDFINFYVLSIWIHLITALRFVFLNVCATFAVWERKKERLNSIVHTHAAQFEHVYVFSEGGILPGHVWFCIQKSIYFQTPEMKKKTDMYGQLIIKEKADKQ